MEDGFEEKFGKIKFDSLNEAFSGRDQLLRHVLSAEKTFESKAAVGREDGLTVLIVDVELFPLCEILEAGADGREISILCHLESIFQ